MVLTLVVVALPITAVLVLKPSRPGNPVHVIDTASFQTALTAARSAEPFTVLVPKALPAGWRPTSESYQAPGAAAADWHVGYLTPSGGYAEFEQTTQEVAGFLSDQHADAVQGIGVQAGGQIWQRYTGSTPAALRVLLVHTDAKSTQIVAGSAPLAELEQLAASLE